MKTTYTFETTDLPNSYKDIVTIDANGEASDIEWESSTNPKFVLNIYWLDDDGFNYAGWRYKVTCEGTILFESDRYCYDSIEDAFNDIVAEFEDENACIEV